jgi:ABC-type dipeptide/oligopeptide/nickel transport system permease component
MVRFILRRLLVIPPVLVLVNFLGFVYALVAQTANAATNPFFAAARDVDILAEYAAYAQGVLRGDLGALPTAAGKVSIVLGNETATSAGLLAVAFVLCTLVGLLFAIGATRVDSSNIARWLPVLSAGGLSMPGFYAGTLLIAGILALAPQALPVNGYGTVAHFVLPTLALAARPTVQIAQITAGLLAGEAGKQYLTAARSFGYAQNHLRWRHMLPNVLGSVILTIAASLRLLVVEMVIVERLFNWPGLGRLLSYTLVAPRLSQPEGGELFLQPPLVAAILVILVAFFLVADLIAAVAVRAVDPRVRAVETLSKQETSHA